MRKTRQLIFASCDYCLNPAHPEGQHKARLFVAALGMTEADAEPLRDALLQVVKAHDATLGRRDAYGQRYQIDFGLSGFCRGNQI